MAEEVATSAAVAKTATFTLEDCKQHSTEKDCWLAIHGKVYNVTDFLDEHPGGFDIVVAASGKDATDDYEEIGHSKAATEMLQQYYIGDFAGGAARAAKPQQLTARATSSAGSALLKALLPLLMALLVAAVLYLRQT